MKSRRLEEDARQYGTRSSGEIRSTLLAFTREFVLAARRLPGVRRLAIVGSLLTPKPRPKDADVLVTIDDTVNLGALAKLGRRLSGSAQAKLNSGADVFLADSAAPISAASATIASVTRACFVAPATAGLCPISRTTSTW